MKNESNFHLFLVIILVAFWVFILVAVSHANDYTITYYGQGVFSIEHDGVIHIQGKGEPEKTGEDRDGGWGGTSNDSESEQTSDLAKAEANELKQQFYTAAYHYRKAGETEKMKEMAYKDIDQELAKDPPDYHGAYETVKEFLKDVDLATEYYKKYLEQHFAREEKENQN